MGAGYGGPGNPQLTFVMYQDGAGLVVSNYSWSSSNTRDVPIRITFDGKREYVPPSSRILGLDSTIPGGAVGITMTRDAVEEFRHSSTMQVYTEDKLVGKFGLNDTADAMLMTQACVYTFEIERAAQEIEEAQYAGVDKDPFAPPALISRANLLNRFEVNDAVTKKIESYLRKPYLKEYPNVYGHLFKSPSKVKFEVGISEEGFVNKCNITETSETPAIDKIVCDTIQEIGRFVPAQNEKGGLVPDTFTSTIVYTPAASGR
jgi:hypothetical protein